MFHGSQSNSENEIACTPSHKYLVSTCTPRVNHLTVRLILSSSRGGKKITGTDKSQRMQSCSQEWAPQCRERKRCQSEGACSFGSSHHCDEGFEKLYP